MLIGKFTKGKRTASEVPTGTLAIVLPFEDSAMASSTRTKNLSGYGTYS
jgi:hypothetical protein